MRLKRKLTEEFLTGYQGGMSGRSYVEIFKNPTSKELTDAGGSEKTIRFIAVTPNEDLYAFGAEDELHTHAWKEIAGEEGLSSTEGNNVYGPNMFPGIAVKFGNKWEAVESDHLYEMSPEEFIEFVKKGWDWVNKYLDVHKLFMDIWTEKLDEYGKEAEELDTIFKQVGESWNRVNEQESIDFPMIEEEYNALYKRVMNDPDMQSLAEDAGDDIEELYRTQHGNDNKETIKKQALGLIGRYLKSLFNVANDFLRYDTKLSIIDDIPESLADLISDIEQEAQSLVSTLVMAGMEDSQSSQFKEAYGDSVSKIVVDLISKNIIIVDEEPMESFANESNSGTLSESLIRNK